MFSRLYSLYRTTLVLLSRSLRMALEFVGAPFRWVGNAGSFSLQLLLQWWNSRHLRSLWWGIPSLLVGILSVASVIVAKSTIPYETAQVYVASARQAAEKEDWHRAQLFFDRAVELGLRDSESIFELASAAQQAGDRSRMSALMNYLAPDDRAVYAPAHLWKATRILEKGKLEKADVELAELHLQLAIQQNPRLQMAHALLGDLYFQTGIIEPAIEHLAQAHRTAVPYRLKLSRALKIKGEELQSTSIAAQILPFAEAESQKDPRDLQNRLNWSEALLLSGDRTKAAEVIVEGLKLADDPTLRQALTLVWIQEADELLKSKGNKGRAFQVLSAALENTPNEILLFDRILKLLSMKEGLEGEEDVALFLQQNIVVGRAVGLSHLILGTHKLENQQPKEAGFHLQQAFKLLPHGPVVANNFAWYLAKTDPADPLRALEIINVLVSEYPQSPEFRDTRGHVYIALERWQEAATDLEAALPVLGNRVETHEALSQVYEKLGSVEIASQHRKLAEQLRNRELQ